MAGPADDDDSGAPRRGGALRRVLQSLLGVVPTLDLHGEKVPQALRLTDEFLTRAAQAGEPRVRIVYGKGRGSPGGVGALRQAVPAWIEQHGGDRVARFERQLDRDGNDGAMLVWLRPQPGTDRDRDGA